MEFVQTRIVTDDVQAMASFYAQLVGADVALNEFYVEVPAGPAPLGFSKCRFTEEHVSKTSCSSTLGARAGETILDFVAADVDGEYDRVDALGVDWVLPPTTQPWGRRSMLFRDPEGRLVSVLSRREVRG